MAKDDSGVGLLHKAVYYDLKLIYKYLVEKYPHIIPLKDSVSYEKWFFVSNIYRVNRISSLIS